MAAGQTLVIRGGTVVDGSGGVVREADVAVRDGKIVEVGAGLKPGHEEIDARGKLVLPGLIDPHTHYDAQVTWDNRLAPSTTNGVTTVLIGNCGVGFAPCAPQDREVLMHLMEGVEDIPLAAMRQGLPWAWESFPQFLDFLDRRNFDADVAAQLPHSAVRLFVMGSRGAQGEPSTDGDRAAMRRIVEEGLRAGALGFSTSRSSGHRTPDGRHIPSYGVAEGELLAAAQALRDAGTGWFQLITDFPDPDAELDMLERIAHTAQRRVTVSMLQKESRPREWRHLLSRIERAQQHGADITAQVIPRATGILMGFELTEHPFSDNPAYRAIAHLPFGEQLIELRKPEVRERMIAHGAAATALAARNTTWEKLYPLGNDVEYEPAPEQSIQAIAQRKGMRPEQAAYDLMMENDGRGMLYRPMSNYADGNLDAIGEMLTHPHTIVGLGDGGAHVGQVCDSNALAFLLTHWTRDRKRGSLFSLPWAVKRVTRDNAMAVGLRDRGLVAPGYKADLNIIDYDRLKLRHPEVAYDLPGGQRRLLQRCDGIVSTIVSGEIVHWNGEVTGALPGRLVRGERAVPAT